MDELAPSAGLARLIYRLAAGLRRVGADDGRYQRTEPPGDLVAPCGVVHLDADALTLDEAGLAQHLEVLRQRRLWDRDFVDLPKRRTDLGALGSHDSRENLYAQRIRQGVQDPFDGNVIYAGME